MLNKLSIFFNDQNCCSLISSFLYEILYPVIMDRRPIVLLCIGSDRSTGDSLGPLVGHKLSSLKYQGVYIYGSLESPVHAKNLNHNINDIYNKFINPFVISVDASLGSLKNVGRINLETSPLNPGAALNKDLPTVGDISITGTVNISGSLNFFILQNTRLYTVMMLAETISKGLYECFSKVYEQYIRDSSFKP